MKSLDRKVVALTGAASGIGRALAVELAGRGARLALADVDEAGLAETDGLLGTNGRAEGADGAGDERRVTTHLVDVADRDRMRAWAAEVVEAHGGVDVIVNNAGVAGSGRIEDITYEQFDWVFHIDFYGVLYGTKEFLPHLRQRPEGHIVNISSVNAFVPFPGNGPYNSAKHAVKGLNQTLQQELAGTGIHVTSVHPGGIKTNIVRGSRQFSPLIEGAPGDIEKAAEEFDRIASTTSEEAARTIVQGILKDKQRVLVGTDAHLIDVLVRLFPQRFSNATGRIMIRGQQRAARDAAPGGGRRRRRSARRRSG